MVFGRGGKALEIKPNIGKQSQSKANKGNYFFRKTKVLPAIAAVSESYASTRDNNVEKPL
jgi:hypothetical protein